MKKITLFLLCAWLLTGYTTEVNAQTSVNEKIFSLLNLDYPGLEQVKALYQAQKKEEAAQALLSYYRERKDIHHPDINLENIRLSPENKKRADDAMQHIFYGQEGYEPTFYGKDINWKYWPIKDNEIRWMLHRHKWFIRWGMLTELARMKSTLKNGHSNIWTGLKKIHFWRFLKKNMRF